MSEHGTNARKRLQTITEPGIYDLAAEVYHADPCPTPSLSAGMINDLLRAPAFCYENSPRLNLDWEPPEDEGKFSIGSVSHVMFLEPHLFAEKVAVLKFADWRTNDAKTARAHAIADGKTPILEKNMRKIRAARTRFFSNPFTAMAFEGGQFEQSIFWRHPRHGFWCRARPDFIADTGDHLNDYKATANADPAKFGKHAYDMGYHRRAAWYLEGAEIVFGKRPRHYWFCNQEVKAPYLTSIVELDEAALTAGRDENERASELFARCLQTDDWYGYRSPDSLESDIAFRVGLPNWAYMQIDERIA